LEAKTRHILNKQEEGVKEELGVPEDPTTGEAVKGSRRREICALPTRRNKTREPTLAFEFILQTKFGDFVFSNFCSGG